MAEDKGDTKEDKPDRSENSASIETEPVKKRLREAERRSGFRKTGRKESPKKEPEKADPPKKEDKKPE